MRAMTYSWATYPRPILALAPMAGYTDSAFRQVVKDLAPATVVYTEFASTDGIHHGSQRSIELIQFEPAEHPLIVQIFGRNPRHFAEVARMVEEQGAAGIDINMGCPTKKADKCVYGAALLGDKTLALEIVRAARQAITVPLSVKTRLGHDRYDFDELRTFALRLQDLGVNCLAVHGRTAKMKFMGAADFEPLYRLKESLSIPLLGSGDIDGPENYRARLGNLDGLLVGRAAIGNPWVMQAIHSGFERPLSMAERVPVILRHAEIVERQKGRRGLLQLRKQLMAYVQGIPRAKDVRAALSQVNSLEEIRRILETGGSDPVAASEVLEPEAVLPL